VVDPHRSVCHPLFGWTIDGANGNHSVLFAAKRGLLGHIQTICLDCGCDSHASRRHLVERTINDAITAKKKKRGS
jgi:hypothetical protein